MEALAWITSREPQPPPALVARIAQALHGNTSTAGSPISSQLLAAAVGILVSGDRPGGAQAGAAVEARSSASARHGALDLLAADALVTYAMECASDDCKTIGSVADAGVRAICELR